MLQIEPEDGSDVATSISKANELEEDFNSFNPFATGKLSEISNCALPGACFSRIPSEKLTYASSSLARKISQKPLASNIG
jgi:hypothetical protein